ncbi:T9SS type A sorting domain-containing protein [Rapidithrix thailandica]|uniref:T9SS type A sorting domain-containing protein n=1 Tax=Rapidithrix thailandica TaxID=413964 RepID=A0AAW9SBV8_9BACT
MKSNLKINFVSLSFVFCLLTMPFGTSYSQTETEPDRKIQFAQARKEMHEYFKTNIQPVLQTQRNKLDTYLSAQEKEEIVEIRAALKAMHEEHNALRKKGQKRPDFRTLSEEEKQERYLQRKAHRQLMNQAWEIAGNHETDILNLFEDIKQEHQQWREEIKAIMGKFKKKHPEQKDEENHKRHRSRHHKGPGHRAIGLLHSEVHFLLWAPNEDALPSINKEMDLSVFPNPSAETNRLHFSIKKEGLVKITLHKVNGDLVKTLLNEPKAPGSYTENFDISTLKRGVYMYKIVTPDGTISKRFVKE